MLFQLENFLSDPVFALKSLLLFLPGMLLALSLHECAHGWIAEKCGDPTARYSGRITLNPAKHFDPMGFLCMLLIGFGWAKPVPVNPLRFKHYRRDDVLVSLAGITANLLLFFLSYLIMAVWFLLAVKSLPVLDSPMSYYLQTNSPEYCRLTLRGEMCLFTPGGYYKMSDLFPLFFLLSDTVITPVCGQIPGILYTMLMYCMFLNLTLAVFNLIPLPPLDGYHVLNDLVLHQDLFAQARTQRITSGLLLGLILLGNVKPEWDVLQLLFDFVQNKMLGLLSFLPEALAGLLGVI